MAAKTCFLHCMKNSHEPIVLPDGQEIFIGRTKTTNITDTALSRKQVSLTADYSSDTVILKQVGTNHSGLNGFRISQNEPHRIKDGDQVELLISQYIYSIQFQPKPNYTEDSDNVDEHSNSKTETSRSKNEEINSASPLNGNGKHVLVESDTNSRKKLKMSSDSPAEHGDEKMEGSKDIDASKEATEDMWEEIDKRSLIIYTTKHVKASKKIASYDMDGTLITTKSGRVFPKDLADWQILFPEIPGKLKSLYSDGYKIVIFTNQAGIGTGKTKIGDIKVKLENIVKRLGVPTQVFISTGKGKYRKPMTGMWEALINNKNNGIEVSMVDSFYVGDAAGRPEKWAPGKKKDHSLADRLYAENIKIPFHTPEEHFLKMKPAKWTPPEFNPRDISKDIPLCEPVLACLTSDKQEVLLIVGGPGSGKSYVSRELCQNYVHVNRDKLGSWQKCISVMQDSLKKGESVVVDNTNPDKASRKRYIDACKGVPIRCGVMATTFKHAQHNNMFRQVTDPDHQVINDIVMNSYKKSFEYPTVAEGFSEVFKVNFIPQFNNEEHEKLYYMHLLEK